MNSRKRNQRQLSYNVQIYLFWFINLIDIVVFDITFADFSFFISLNIRCMEHLFDLNNEKGKEQMGYVYKEYLLYLLFERGGFVN